MKYLAHILYGVIYGRFVMQVLSRVLHPERASFPGAKYLAMEILDDGNKKIAKHALVFGYSDDIATVESLIAGLFAEGFKPLLGGRMVIVERIAPYIYENVCMNETYGPITFLASTSRGHWNYVFQNFGMKKDILDRLCYEGTAPNERK